MTFKLKPDYQEVKQRYDAFWQGEIIDRALVNIVLPVADPKSVPTKQYSEHKERWLDCSFRAEQDAVSLENRLYLGDALPIAWPNMGPEIFSAWCGCGYGFGENTTWSEPCLFDWERDADKAIFRPDHPLFKLTVDYTNQLLDYGSGNFIVGLTDFHPGGDHLAALRDPQRLAIDLVENLEHVKAKLASSAKEYFHVYNIFYEMLREAGMPITAWTPLICDGRYFIPSNDFSCMISTEMFNDVFLPGIIEECQFYDRSIYHLDGPGALRHLDSLLSISELDAIQWIPGAGNEGFAKWIPVYQRIQDAGKSLQIIHLELSELPLVFEYLRPEGVWISNIDGIKDRETAEAVLKSVKRWR